MKCTLRLLALLVSTSLACADDVTLKDGRILRDYRVLTVAADAVTLAYKGGIVKVAVDLLPEEIAAALQPRLEAAQQNATASSSATTDASPAQPDLAALRRRAEPWLTNRDDIALRKASGDIYPYIEALVARGDLDAARPYLARALKTFPWDFDSQLTYGEILARHGQPDELKRRAEQALRQAEDHAILRRAYPLAGRVSPDAPPELSREAIEGATIVLLQTGEISEYWLYELRDALAQRLGVPVAVAKLPIELGPPNRNVRQQICATVRQRLLERWTHEPGFGAFLQSEGISKHGVMTDDDVVVRAMKLFLRDHGDAALKQLDHELQVLGQTGLQWEISRMILGVGRALEAYNKRRWTFIAVTDRDLFHSPHRFVFGTATHAPPLGLVSAARFTARLYGEPPKRERLITRLLKQTLSTYAFTLDIERCNDPECVRAYPASVLELDAKGDRYCRECRSRIEFATGRALPADPL